jgi:hypothetical protein
MSPLTSTKRLIVASVCAATRKGSPTDNKPSRQDKQSVPRRPFSAQDQAVTIYSATEQVFNVESRLASSHLANIHTNELGTLKS